MKPLLAKLLKLLEKSEKEQRSKHLKNDTKKSALAKALLKKAKRYYDNQEYDLAIECYQKIIAENPKDPDAYLGRGMARIENIEFDEAIQDFSRVLEIKPKDARAYNLRGLAKMYKENYAQAIQDFNKAIELAPDNPDFYENKGMAQLRNGGRYDSKEATLDFETAEQLRKQGESENLSIDTEEKPENFIINDFEKHPDFPKKVYGTVNVGLFKEEDNNTFFRFLYSRDDPECTHGSPHSGYSLTASPVRIDLNSILVFRYRTNGVHDLRMSLGLTNQSLGFWLDLRPSKEWKEVRLPLGSKFKRDVINTHAQSLRLTTFAKIPDGVECVFLDLDDFHIELSGEISESLRIKNAKLHAKQRQKEEAAKKYLKIQNMTSDKEIYDPREEVIITYDIVNTSTKTLYIPLNKQYSRSMRLIGTVQHWVETVETDEDGNVIAVLRRRPAGGTIVPIRKDTLAPGEKFSRKKRDAFLRSGKYRYIVEYRKWGLTEETSVIFTVGEDVEGEVPTQKKDVF